MAAGPVLTDAVEKVADDLGEPFHLSILGCLGLRFLSGGNCERVVGVQLPRLDATDAQVTHTAGMFIAGRQI
jgi:hypothetical protein